MNERIKELAKRAGGNPNYKAFRGHFLPPPPDYIHHATVDLEKFAELIVQECMTLMNNERDYYSKPGSYEPESYYIRCAAKEDAFDEAAILIKQHFGV